MMNIQRIGALFVLGLSSVLFTATGCGRAGTDVCEAKCDCERCTDREHEACLIDTGARIDTADAYDCSAQYQALEDCQLKRSRCDGLHWHLSGGDCSGEAKVLSDCIHDGSRL